MSLCGWATSRTSQERWEFEMRRVQGQKDLINVGTDDAREAVLVSVVISATSQSCCPHSSARPSRDGPACERQ